MDESHVDLPHGEDFDEESPAAAMARLRDSLTAVHPQAAAIVTAHAALELEVSRAVRSLLARPDKLPRLSAKHELGVLRALLDDAWLDLVLDAIGGFGAVRNCVAHGDNDSAIATAISRLRDKLDRIGIPLSDSANFGTVAMGLAGALHVGMER